MKTQTLQLLATTDYGTASGNYDGSAASFNGDAVKAAAYSSSTGTSQTVGIFTEDLIGNVVVQATVDSTVASDSWFDVYTFSGDGSSTNDTDARYYNLSQNITGRYTWMRVKVTGFTQGVIHKVTLSY
jgi:hypothetical protein